MIDKYAGIAVVLGEICLVIFTALLLRAPND
jgi:hypothetical protein